MGADDAYDYLWATTGTADTICLKKWEAMPMIGRTAHLEVGLQSAARLGGW